MEFIQYHPTGLPGTGILITEAARGEGGIMVNKDGYRYLQDYDLGKPLDINNSKHPVKKSMELGPRDRLSQAFVGEREKGRTISGPYGPVVHLDIRHLGEKKIDKKIPFVRELSNNYAGIDPVYKPIPVRPVVHYMMGGIDTDITGATALPSATSKHQKFRQGVRSQAVSPIDGDAGTLSCIVQTGEGSSSCDISIDPSHHVVNDRPDRDWFVNGVNAGIIIR
jgi:succinate dehydrogenase/fumarate reductase flavoprotein subunit